MLPKVASGLDEAREQVDRILASDTLRTSEALRRLLRFLADKTFSGEADSLKEYTVGLDALGKPPTYDTRQDAGVRLQASRLRLKLEEYYRTEGRDDPLRIEMPKGRFKIIWRPTGGDGLSVASVELPAANAFLPVETNPGADSRSVRKWRNLAIGLSAILLAFSVVGIWSFFRASGHAAGSFVSSVSTPELDALWSPFLSPAHHLIIAFSNPMFVRFQLKGGHDIVYRRREMTGWDNAVSAPEFTAFKRWLGNPSATASFNFVERSNLVSTFVLSQFLARRRSDVSVARMDELSWQQFADNDIVLLASSFRFDQSRTALPTRPAFISDKEGIRNLRPAAGEPQLYADGYDHQESNGEGLELISVLPGPLGRTTIVSFTGNHAWGVIGGVQALTDPAFARPLVKKLRGRSRELPAYYQIVIKIGYRDGTPTNATYVTHRALDLTQNLAEVEH